MPKNTQLPSALWESLPSNLRDAAYRSASEVAWIRQDALSVVEFLHEQGYAVLGVDIWIPTGTSPTVPEAVCDLDSSRLPSEVWHTYVERSYGQAKKFISTFEFDEDDRAKYKVVAPLFNVWAETQDEK